LELAPSILDKKPQSGETIRTYPLRWSLQNEGFQNQNTKSPPARIFMKTAIQAREEGNNLQKVSSQMEEKNYLLPTDQNFGQSKSPT